MNAKTGLCAGIALAALAGAALLGKRAYDERMRRIALRPYRDYRTRSGFPRPASEMRGRASAVASAIMGADERRPVFPSRQRAPGAL